MRVLKVMRNISQTHGLLRRVMYQRYFEKLFCRNGTGKWPWHAVPFFHLHLQPRTAGAGDEEQKHIPGGEVSLDAHIHFCWNVVQRDARSDLFLIRLSSVFSLLSFSSIVYHPQTFSAVKRWPPTPVRKMHLWMLINAACLDDRTVCFIEIRG